jgi:hypothetical protein
LIQAQPIAVSTPAFAQPKVALVELALVEQVTAVDEGVLALGVPAPAVERADEALRLGIAVAAGCNQRYPAVAAGVVIGADPVPGPGDDHRAPEVGIFDPVADVLDRLEPAGHLPHVRPQLLVLELVEILVVIALGRNLLRIGDLEGNVGHAEPLARWVCTGW